MPYIPPAPIDTLANYAACRYEASGAMLCKPTKTVKMTCGPVLEEFRVDQDHKTDKQHTPHPYVHASMFTNSVADVVEQFANADIKSRTPTAYGRGQGVPHANPPSNAFRSMMDPGESVPPVAATQSRSSLSPGAAPTPQADPTSTIEKYAPF